MNQLHWSGRYSQLFHHLSLLGIKQALANTHASSPTMSADKSIVLYTFATPNGVAASILLEELKATYPGFNYESVTIDISKKPKRNPGSSN